MNEQITISSELWQRVIERNHLLACLLAVGVEQWPGYRVALAMMDDGPNVLPMAPGAPVLARVERPLLPG